jgi:hypothetical protein
VVTLTGNNIEVLKGFMISTEAGTSLTTYNQLASEIGQETTYDYP